MAYFITASASSSVVQTTFDTTGSIITSSLYTPNDPLNVDNITTIKKSRSQYPNLNRPIYKESVSFTNNNGTDINWLYDNTASRDSDFNIIKALNTNYEKSGGSGTIDTGSFATTGSNVFVGNQVITGSISASGQLTVGTASIAGITYPIADGDNGDIIYTDGAGNLTFDKTKTYASVKNVAGGTLYKGTPVHASSSVGNTNEVIASSASNAATMPATFILAQDLADEEEGLGIVMGFINGVNTTGFNEGDVVYVGANGGYTDVKPSGSNLIQNLGIITKVGVNGSGYIYGAGRSNDTPNLLHNNIFYGSGSDQTYQTHLSGALDTTIINNITSSGNISSSGNITATSFIGDGSSLTNLQRPTSLSVSANMTASNDNAGYFFEVGAVTCSIQSSSLVACDIGSEFEFFQSSSGNFIFVTGSGVTLMSKGGALTLTGQYSGASLKKIRAEEWVLVGDLT
jgi:hypothetical protein